MRRRIGEAGRGLRLRVLVTLLASLLGAPGATAQRPPAAAAAPATPAAPGAALTVYLMTMGAGDLVWERFGHNAIWIHDAARGTDAVYNWGMFDFQQPGFLRRFLTGDTRYWVASFDLASTLEVYTRLNRTVLVQELELTPAQRAELQRFAEWNEQPANRYYRYDYYRDNCSTRVRDALDRVVGGRVRAATAGATTTTTYRWHTQRLTSGDFPVYTGIQLALGHPADRPISKWEEMFLPVRMSESLRAVRVPGEGGALRPLVKRERVLFQARRPPEPAEAPNRTGLYLALGVALAAVLAFLAGRGARGRRGARFAFVAVAGLWALVAGVLGSAALGAWTLTQHVFMYRNENLLQFNPLPLLLLVLVPLAVTSGRARGAALSVAWTVAGLSLLGFVLQALPGMDQPNGEIIALALPAHAALAWGLGRLMDS